MRITVMSNTDFGPFDVEPHLGVLRRYALVLTRSSDEAEDLVQQFLLRAIAQTIQMRLEVYPANQPSWDVPVFPAAGALKPLARTPV